MVKLKKFDFGKGTVAADTVLSPLESDVIGKLWGAGELTVRDLHKKLRGRYALTSVAVSLDRLFQKKLVNRRINTGRGGIHYIYSARQSKQEFEKSVVQQAVDKLIERFGPSAVSYFDEKYGK
ncbi:MAG TPA: BlaI/MecI/CopY family transcriptional regulator [Candidatus Norongarragalinales archaeon]|nr:BlaI/MecI/CopY family transcriptional regulator [Candidatus Norongarragalinales archaeon]